MMIVMWLTSYIFAAHTATVLEEYIDKPLSATHLTHVIKTYTLPQLSEGCFGTYYRRLYHNLACTHVITLIEQASLDLKQSTHFLSESSTDALELLGFFALFQALHELHNTPSSLHPTTTEVFQNSDHFVIRQLNPSSFKHQETISSTIRRYSAMIEETLESIGQERILFILHNNTMPLPISAFTQTLVQGKDLIKLHCALGFLPNSSPFDLLSSLDKNHRISSQHSLEHNTSIYHSGAFNTC